MLTGMSGESKRERDVQSDGDTGGGVVAAARPLPLILRHRA